MTDTGSARSEPPDETPDLYGAFPQLSEAQIQHLVDHGRRVRPEVGEVLYREGQTNYDFIVVLEGKVAVIEGYGGPDERIVGVHGPRRFLGEMSLLTGQAAFVTAVVVEGGEVLVVPVERLRSLVLEDTALGDLILRSYLQRRAILIEVGVGFRILGSCYSPDTRRLREFAARNRLPQRFRASATWSRRPAITSRSTRRGAAASSSAGRSGTCSRRGTVRDSPDARARPPRRGRRP
jgi:thioredoxin reductase (NADPH)